MSEPAKPLTNILPMIRQTMIFAPPWSPSQAVTVQVVITPEPDAGLKESPREGELEELKEAGWFGSSNSAAEANVRVIL